MEDERKIRTIKARAVSSRAPSERRRAFLTVIGGSYADLGKHLIVEDRAVHIGRSPDCDLILQDPGVSWRHARITPGPDERYTLDDEGSTNGTRVHGTLVNQSWRLRDGETLQLHDTLLRFALADDDAIRYHQEVAHLVGTDPLTGLVSKRRFDDTLEHLLHSARHAQTPLTLVMMDMDGVKRINDTHGHPFGAHSIATVGGIIHQHVAPTGQACRYGGDEFIAYLTHQGSEGALELCEAIRHAVEHADIRKDGVTLSPTISIGVALYPAHGDEVIDLIRAADEALYDAKARGRNRVRLYRG